MEADEQSKIKEKKNRNVLILRAHYIEKKWGGGGGGGGGGGKCIYIYIYILTLNREPMRRYLSLTHGAMPRKFVMTVKMHPT